MKKLVLILSAVVLLAGCAATKQAIQDYGTGKATPIAANETAPAAKAEVIAAPVKALPVPFAPIAGSVVAFLATVFFTWQRGAAIRKNNGVVPASTETSTVPHFVQDISNVMTGAFTILNNNSLTGTVLQRVWKVALAVSASGVAVAAADPAVGTFLSAHPLASAAFVAISSGIAGLEKGLSNLPAQAATTTATAQA